MRTAIVIALSVAALSAGVAAGADQKADQQFCEAVAAFHADVAALNAIGPQSTVAELRAATDRIEKDAANMQKTAGKMKTPAAKQFTDAVKYLKQDVKAIPNNATIEQARTKIHADVQNAQAAGQKLAAESGCPATPPQPPQP